MEVSNMLIGYLIGIIVAQGSQLFGIYEAIDSFYCCATIHNFTAKGFRISQIFEVTIRKMVHFISRIETRKNSWSIATS
jgi:hypothetical protein